MPILDPQHDFGHAHEDSPDWSESYYFNGYSPASEVGFFARIAIRPNEPHVDGFITLWLPDGRSVRLAHASATVVPEVGSPTVACLQAVRVTPMMTWHLRGSGCSDEGCAVQLDLTFSALTPAIGVDAQGRQVSAAAGNEVLGSLGHGHFEQSGCWRGEVQVDGERWNVEGRGNRDKSWGPRRSDGAHGMRYWRWFSMNFGDEVHLGGIRVGFDNAAMQRGWLSRQGELVSLRELTLTTRLAADGLSQAHVTLLARDKTGDTHTITGEVLRCAPLIARGHEHMLIVEGLTRWHYQGLTGYGICEYAHQTDAARRPVVPID